MGHLVQPSCQSRVIYSRLHRTLSRQIFNISREGDSTTSLGSLFQGSVTLRVKRFFLMFRRNFLCYCTNYICTIQFWKIQNIPVLNSWKSDLFPFPFLSAYFIFNQIPWDSKKFQHHFIGIYKNRNSRLCFNLILNKSSLSKCITKFMSCSSLILVIPHSFQVGKKSTWCWNYQDWNSGYRTFFLHSEAFPTLLGCTMQ